LPAEVEAKIRLVALNRQSSGLGVGYGEPLMGDYDCQRLSTERLLDLLDRKDLWPDVDFGPDGTREGNYQGLVLALPSVSGRYFRPEHVPRLKAVLARESAGLGWQAGSVLIVGISRLLPEAPEGQLDNLDTREGMLQSAVRSHGASDLSGIVAKELMRAALAKNLEFLHEAYFGNPPYAEDGGLRLAILQVLGAPPLNADKRRLLANLLLDARFEPLWSEWLLANYDDVCREYGIRALRAHAGKQLLPDWELKPLFAPIKKPGVLREIRQIIETNLIQSGAEIRNP
jgi:hypothetical protein